MEQQKKQNIIENPKKNFFGYVDMEEVMAIREAELVSPQYDDEPDYESMSTDELELLYKESVTQELDDFDSTEQLELLESANYFSRKSRGEAKIIPVARLEADKLVADIMPEKKKDAVPGSIIMTKTPRKPLPTFEKVEFYTENGFTFARDENGEVELLFEGILKIIKRKVHIMEEYASNGRVTSYNVEAKFVVSLDVNGALYRTEVDVETFDSGKFLGQMSLGEVALEKNSNTKKLFAKLAKNLRRQRDYDSVIAFDKPGWKQYGKENWYYVLPTGVIGDPEYGVVVENNRAFGTVAPYEGSSVVNDFLSMRAIFTEHRENAIVMQYYFIMALMKTLLREAQMNPQFLLAIIGETNAKKTTIATLFFKLYEREGGPDIDFTATRVALEEAAAANADAVTIYDDITPPNTRGAEVELKNKVESLTRTFGGNLPRKRSKVFCATNPGVSEFTPVMSQAVITGEVLPVTLRSSRSRILKLDFSANDCDNRILTFHQQHLEIVPAFAMDFLAFISAKQKLILRNFRDRFQDARNKNECNLKIPRFRETYAMFVATVYTFAAYISSKRNTSEDMLERLVADDLIAIGAVIKANDTETNARPDESLIAECILDTLSSQEAGNRGGSPLDRIYMEDAFLVIYPPTAETMFRAYFERSGKIFPYTKSELYKFLAEKGMIKVSNEDGKVRHTQKFRAADGSERRFLKFYKAALEKYLE